MGGGVGTDVGALTIGQDGLAALSDEGEGVGEAGSANGADETSESSERELHCDGRIVIVNENQWTWGRGIQDLYSLGKPDTDAIFDQGELLAEVEVTKRGPIPLCE